jgi:hypothetical protein
MKRSIFWDKIRCRQFQFNRRFGGTCSL